MQNHRASQDTTGKEVGVQVVKLLETAAVLCVFFLVLVLCLIALSDSYTLAMLKCYSSFTFSVQFC